LFRVQCEVYALPPVQRVRLDATTTYGYHASDDDGLMQLGHSKDHRPDLPQIKLMAAAAEPAGLFLAGDVHPGNAADDPLYLPLYRRVRTMLGQTGLLYTGDCKMAALETRAEIAKNGDLYLTRLPMTGEVAAQFASWVEAAITGAKASQVVALRVEDELLGVGYEFERGRTGKNRPKKTEWSVRYQITTGERIEPAIGHQVERLGWQVQVTNVPAQRLSVLESLQAYRGGWCGERLFHLFKDKPLGIRPLYVRRDDQIQGLTHLVTLALRVLTLFELLVRRGQEQSGERLPGLYPGLPKRTTDRPTGKRVLEAISRAEITLTQVESGDGRHWHL